MESHVKYGLEVLLDAKYKHERLLEDENLSPKIRTRYEHRVASIKTCIETIKDCFSEE
ncbi:hypothetical protein [Priestia megaterium]|uniref:hypothetical protein n=1 Tax=Priestia megaterium TaxID=1404 RepID=UPI001672D298|nr:hypothetical protein [Priestia megaterium]